MFKIGDKVKIKEGAPCNKVGSTSRQTVGWVFKLMGKGSIYDIYVRFNDREVDGHYIDICPYYNEELELYDPQLLLFE